jgi:LuxR family maltose regulon positive regulatory protein
MKASVHFEIRREISQGGGALTTREIEVMELLLRGQADKEIAQELQIGVSTVRYHMRNLFSKYEATSRSELIVRAIDGAIQQASARSPV